jgi:hypothetical protein
VVAAEYPLLEVFLSILYFFALVIWFFAVAAVIIDIFRSHDMSGWAKAAWFVFVFLVPLIGLLAYLVVRGPKIQRRTTDELERLANLRDRGAITDDEFEQQKAVLLG